MGQSPWYPAGDTALEKVGHGGGTLKFYSSDLLPGHSLLPDTEVR